MFRIAILGITVSTLLSPVLYAQNPQVLAQKQEPDLHDTIVKAREDETRLDQLYVKVEGNHLFCNGPWMKSFTNEEFDKLIAEFQSVFSQPKNGEQDGIQYLADRLQSERTQLPSFQVAITLEQQGQNWKSSTSNETQNYQSTHITDGEYHAFLFENRNRVDIFRGNPSYLTYSLDDFRFPADPWLITNRVKFQNHFLVVKLDADRYEVTIDPDQNPPDTFPYQFQYRFNTKTRLVEEWKTILNGQLHERFLAIGERALRVQKKNILDREVFWFPQYCLKIKYHQGKPSGIRVQRIESVELIANKILDAKVPVKEGTEVVLVRGTRRESQGKMRKDFDDILEVYRERLSSR